MNSILKIVLLITAGILSYFIYDSINTEVKFGTQKMDRYALAVTYLQDVADAERLYKTYFGQYTDDLDSLKNYVENGKILIISRRDSSAYVYNAKKRIDEMKNFTLFDTLISPVSVKDSIFEKPERFQNFGYVPVEGTKVPIDLYASYSDRFIGNDSTKIQRDHYFKATVNKRDILQGLPENNVEREMFSETSPIDGELIQVGSDSRPSLEGNWSAEVDTYMKSRKALK